MGTLNRHMTRVPNTRAITPAVNSGSVTMSSRQSQNIVDSRTGPMMLNPSAAMSSGRPMM